MSSSRQLPDPSMWSQVLKSVQARPAIPAVATGSSIRHRRTDHNTMADLPTSFSYTPKSIRTHNSVVYLEYDPENLPPPPSEQWTRFVCISDTHTKTCPVPDGDVLLHSGDLTKKGTMVELETAIDWLCSLPHKIKISHRRHSQHRHLVSRLPSLDSPPSLDFDAPRLTHGPPLAIFDRTRGGQNAGCQYLRARLPHLRPRLHVFGHIHEARGGAVHAWSSTAADELLRVQNGFGEEEVQPEVEVEMAERGGGEPQEGGTRDETVFVNAACSPSGPSAWCGAQRVPFGGPGFQPIVIDLRD
ncbi:hypothetical protein H0H81_001321 [Sphagnurus paluster]|uniref:Metallophosphoesterase domain-containing protein 1 n=1 Tax=Sphagnurus paluster TaxID=117069 RepID=A0A9P7GH84_9AGAR|nr:hypothetical protein H0H81_001321 [Sphagnurus paluster]